MPRRLHTGRPGSSAIPAGWAAAHRPVTGGTRNGAVALREPGTTQTWSEAAQENIAAPKTPYWTGAARIQALGTQARPVTAAADPETTASYLVAVDADVTAAEGDLVAVTTVDDPALAGRTLRILQVVTGTERFERDLFCTLSD